MITRFGKSIPIKKDIEIEPDKNKITISEAILEALKNQSDLGIVEVKKHMNLGGAQEVVNQENKVVIVPNLSD